MDLGLGLSKQKLGHCQLAARQHFRFIFPPINTKLVIYQSFGSFPAEAFANVQNSRGRVVENVLQLEGKVSLNS